jgi:hypothetical protein
MNDDFIYEALPKIRKDFAELLYSRISANKVDKSWLGMYPKARRRRWLQMSMIVLGLLLLVAWSQVAVWNRYRYVPIGDLWLVEMSHPTKASTGQQPTLGLIPTPVQAPKVIVEGTVYYLVKDVKYLSPNWIPTGFEEMPQEMNSYGDVITTWRNSAQETIRLVGVPQVGGMHPYAPADMYEEISVNGQPAVLIHGRLALTNPENPTARRKWDKNLGLQLHWILDDAVYNLETFGPYLSEGDLIRMAESMKVVPWPQVP